MNIRLYYIIRCFADQQQAIVDRVPVTNPESEALQFMLYREGTDLRICGSSRAPDADTFICALRQALRQNAKLSKHELPYVIDINPFGADGWKRLTDLAGELEKVLAVFGEPKPPIEE
jgi:hypothetical protein